MGRKCSYPECNSTEGLHSLPANTETLHRWLLALGRTDLPSAAIYVCNLHFTRECFSNYAEVEMGFKKQLLLYADAVPTPTRVVSQGSGGGLPGVRDVASQTDPPVRRSVGTQLSKKTLQNPFRSTATQVKVQSKDCGMFTCTFPLDSPLLFLEPTIVRRAAKRPRITDDEEGPP